MPRLTRFREDEIRALCAGKGMVHAYLLFELFDEIRELNRDRQVLVELVLEREKRGRQKATYEDIWSSFFLYKGRTVDVVADNHNDLPVTFTVRFLDTSELAENVTIEELTKV
jgi:hypothetical protein